MKRILPLVILFTLCLAASAQDKYESVLAQTQSISKYEAIYHLISYQKAHPQFHAVYYQLGEKQSELISDYHPIRNYTELHDCLYRTQLYYGNCIHYAQGQTLRANYYPAIPTDKRTIEYDTLYALATAKRERIQQLQAATDTLYNRYHRMVDFYDECRRLFTQFLQDYPSEKDAHLTLSDSSRTILENISSMFDAFEANLHAYRQVQVQPIVVRHTAISLYRLDGLTAVDFLQDTVAIWDYRSWSQRFLHEQNTFYRTYFQDIEQAFSAPNPILINRINRTDYQSFMIPLIRLFGNEALYQPCRSLDSLYAQYTYLAGAEQDVRLVERRVSEDDIRKYYPILSRRQLSDVQSINTAARAQKDVLNNLYTAVCEQFADSCARADSIVYYDDVLDLRIARTQLPMQWQSNALVVMPYTKNLMAIILPNRVEFVPLSDLLRD